MDIGKLLEGYPSRGSLLRGRFAGHGSGLWRAKSAESFFQALLVLTLCSSLVRLPLDLELGEDRVPLGARCQGRSEPPQSTFVSLISLIYEVE